tara:strand:- start:253 stop:441 length:189 start_codon:yes stop_codon:yes gene_type:complete
MLAKRIEKINTIAPIRGLQLLLFIFVYFKYGENYGVDRFRKDDSYNTLSRACCVLSPVAQPG